MATKYGIDLGQVYKTAEAVKGSRQQRDVQNRIMKWKTSDRELASAKRDHLSQLKGDVAAGKEGAMQALNLFDSKEAESILSVMNTEDKRQIDEMQRGVDMMARSMNIVRLSKDPVGEYARVRERLISMSPESAEQLPELTDPVQIESFVNFQMGRAKQMDDVFQNPDVITFGGEDIKMVAGEELERTESGALQAAKIKAGGKGAGFPKTSDDNQAYRATVQALTGMDLSDKEQGALYSRKFSQERRTEILGMAARASELMREKGLNPNSAAAAAVKEFDEKGKQEKPKNALRVFNPKTGKFD
ncbi:MAG: hypothetical protein KAT62_03620 [Desulfuromonadales bacterium]|nr:hypothetical protein [Desulfuromonadales bacterium]